MKLFLIRHAECPLNVGAATGDGLTDDGKLQAQCLAQHFRDSNVRFSKVFSSDLERAAKTAETLCHQQLGNGILTPVQISTLREQQSVAPPSSSSNALRSNVPAYAQEESLVSMKARSEAFLKEYILPLMVANPVDEDRVAVVAHGGILQVLWLCLTALFNPQDIQLGPGIGRTNFDDQNLPVWSNTGYMELDINQATNTPQVGSTRTSAPLMLTGSYALPARGGSTAGAPLSGWAMTVRAVDDTGHLRRTHLGSMDGAARVPAQQQPMDQFYRLVGSV